MVPGQYSYLMEAIAIPTLAELSRIMNEDPREMPADVLAWAIDVLDHRVSLIPPGTPAHEGYALRLRTLNRFASAR